MRRGTYILLLTALVAFSFLCGFTYEDLSRPDGLRGFLASVQLLPSRLSAAVRSELSRQEGNLPPVETAWNVFLYLNTKYYGKRPDAHQLTYAAIRGMLASLGDRYTRFLDPKEYERLREENQGDFQGIGAELNFRRGRVYVEDTIENSPAEVAGLKAGDIILKVNDNLIQGLGIEEVVSRIRGDRGTKVKLTIKREGVAEPLDFEMIRDVIPFKIVECRMEDQTSRIGYIALRQFNERSDQQFDDALTKLESQNMRGLILDLRRNPGGLLDVAVDIGSRFIPSGNVVIIQDRGGRRTSLKVEESKHNHRAYPLVVLINGTSASASEIIAGAIQDHKAGTLVGTDTFGKGLVQTIVNLERDKSAVCITTAKYLTPAGRDVNKEKIHPDLTVEPTEEDLKNRNDVQLKRAVALLKERLGENQAGSQTQARENSQPPLNN